MDGIVFVAPILNFEPLLRDKVPPAKTLFAVKVDTSNTAFTPNVISQYGEFPTSGVKSIFRYKTTPLVDELFIVSD